jgi:hypothetical protein
MWTNDSPCIEGVEGAAAAYTGDDGLSKSKEQWGVSLYVLRPDPTCIFGTGTSSSSTGQRPTSAASGELRMRGVLVTRCGKSGKTNQGCVMVLPHALVTGRDDGDLSTVDASSSYIRQSVVLHAYGRAVQVEPMKPLLKAPGSMILKLRYDGPLSNFAFNFNSRRYTTATRSAPPTPS